LMHRDILPLRPFSQENPLLGLIGHEALHLACVGAGLVALAWLGMRYRWERVSA
jgi:hypothetical protein